MALRWSSEFSVAEFQDIQADTIALDYDSNVVLLAGRRHLAVKRLNDTTEVIEKFGRNQRYSTSVAEWNMITGYRHTFAITTNESVAYAQISEGRLVTMSTMKHHTRQVTDFNWHKTEPSMLASGSADATALVWDLRDQRRPVIVFSSVAGVNQVRWNKLSSYLVATAHDGDLRIWDQRKGSMPIQYIAAHSNKVHGIDWSQTHEYQLASCSQDCSVKLFDMTNPRRAESVMHTTGPVWRVSYTPWGEGLMTVVIPTNGEDSALQLWNLSSHTGPVYTFGGPLGTVLEAHWRRDVGEYQLVTWSQDHCLRIWRIEPFLQRLCGYIDADVQADSDSDAGPSNSDIADAEIGTIAALESPGSPVALSFGESTGMQLMERGTARRMEDEFELLETTWNTSNLSCRNTDVANRSCFIVASVNSYQVSLLISFPPSYPYNAAPSFQIEESSLVDPVLKTKLLKVLKQSAQQRVRKNRTCLDCCLTQLISTLEGTAQLPEERVPAARVPLGSSPARVANAASVYSSFHDDYIPYPRSSGARFCSVGMLVTFNRPSRVSARQEPATPRSYSAATNMSFGGSYVGSFPRYGVSNSSQDVSDIDSGFFLPDRSLSRAISRASRSGKVQRIVAVYDAAKLFLIHRELAEKYVLNLKDIEKTCKDNAATAASVGRSDLVQVWTLASLAAKESVQDEMPWSKHPLSAAKMDYLIQHYTKISDVQTAAMLSCIFPQRAATKTDLPKPLPPVLSATGRFRFKVGQGLQASSPYHTIHLPETTQTGWTVAPFKHSRSNSWSESVEEVTANIIEHREANSDTMLKKPKGFDIREELKRRYADILHMWGLLEVRVRVLKLLDKPPVQHSGLDFLLDCQNCKKPVVGAAFCSLCQRLTLRCSICRVLVRGASKVCLVCGHGGHAEHIIAWFSVETVCPTGCGCNCLSETRDAFDI